MSNLSQANAHLLASVDEMIRAVIRDYDSCNKESIRVNKILNEATISLRKNFVMMDKAARATASVSPEFQRSFDQVITTLQFEDITSQIICHQIEHQRLAKSMLQRIQDVLSSLTMESDSEMQEQLTLMLQQELKAFTHNIPEFDSVRQGDLTAGETELF